MERAKTIIVLTVIGTVLAACATWAEDKKPSVSASTPAPAATSASTKEVVWPANKILFIDLAPGMKQAVLSNDPARGEYTVLSKFQAGFNTSLHAHPNDVRIVIISGAFLYGTEKGEIKLGPGSYLVIPAGRNHSSGATARSDCLFLESSPGKLGMKGVGDQPATK